MKLEFKCPICGKKANVTAQSVLASKKFIVLDCGHCYTEKALSTSEIDPTLNDGRLLYDFQKAGVDFARNSEFRCLIADEMGLGKTIQVVSALKNYREDLLPALIVVKASLKIQWMRELFNGAGIIAQILETKSTVIVDPRFTAYITTYDSLRNAKWKDSIQYRTLVLDECQQIKNHDSKRTQQVRDLARDTKFIMATSGTPIKNNAGEYFPILNIIKPELFKEQSAFITTWTHSYRTGFGWKVGGLRNPSMFKEYTKDFIIRRSRKEVLPDLPKIRRSYRYTGMNEEVGRQYQKESNNLQDYLMNSDEEEGEGRTEHILAMMNRLRHLTGFAKIETVLAYVEEFIESEEGEKLTIFHHHIDVADVLELKLAEMEGIKIFRLKGSMNAEDRAYIVDAFKDYQGAAILLAPTLACGEGINLQFCSHAILMEREWNPSNEEQAEGRFSRIGSTADSVEVIYPVAIGSIDEMFAEYVERKRQYVGEAMEGVAAESKWNQSQIIRDITEKLMTGGYKPFRLS
jgi:SWI/SNF-related matrix-associated actin-dependent regulator 1 of chromatin subfamily A